MWGRSSSPTRKDTQCRSHSAVGRSGRPIRGRAEYKSAVAQWSTRFTACFLAACWLGALPLRGEEPAEPPPPGAHTVRTVTFEGREIHAEQTLLALAGIRPGDPWTEAAAVEVVRQLAAAPFLAEIGLPRAVPAPGGGVDVLIRVRERRLIGSVRFLGQDALLESTLLQAAGLESGKPLLNSSLSEAKEGILARYHEDGFLLAEVEIEVLPGAGGRADVSVQVREGRRLYVRDVRIEGAEQISAGEVLSMISLQPRRFFGFISRGYYVPGRIAEDLQRIRRFYRSRGHLAVEAFFGGIEIDEKRSECRVALQVREGPRYKLLGTRIEGNRLFSRAHFESEGPLPEGGYYSEEAAQDGLRRILRWYQEHADIVPRVVLKREYQGSDGVTIVYEVREEEHYTTGLVKILGNRRTRDRAIRKDVTLVPGGPFTLLELERTEERLRANGALAGFEVRDRPAAEPNVRDVEVIVDEKQQTGMWEAGGGASAGAGEVAYFHVRESNLDIFRLPVSWGDWSGAFRGGGQTLDLEVIPGSRESEYRFRFTEPYFFRSDLALSLGGGTSIYDRRTYDETRLRAALLLQKHFDRDRRWSLSLGYIADAVNIDDVDGDAPVDVFDAQGHTFLGYPRAELKYDALEPSYFSGPRGLLAAGTADFGDSATGSELDFARASLSVDAFAGFFDDRIDYQHVVRVSADLGWIEGLGEDIPLFERYYLGGPRSFPGFRYRRLGPSSGRTALGGEGMLHGAVEYSLPLVRPELRAFGLFDWGDLEPSFSRLDLDRFRTAAGGGLHIRLKIGEQRIPATLYWMKALSSERGDREQLFSFTVGINF